MQEKIRKFQKIVGERKVAGGRQQMTDGRRMGGGARQVVL